jgi:hypothetical protein
LKPLYEPPFQPLADRALVLIHIDAHGVSTTAAT